MIQNRLSWQALGPWETNRMEEKFGPGVWTTLSEAEWQSLPWGKRTFVVFAEDTTGDREDQYRTLQKWAETHYQPIRDVRMEWREIADDEAGWQS